VLSRPPARESRPRLLTEVLESRIVTYALAKRERDPSCRAARTRESDRRPARWSRRASGALREASESVEGTLGDREAVMRAIYAANRSRADRARHADRTDAPLAPFAERHRLCADKGVLAEPCERRMPCRSEEDEAGVTDAFGLWSRHRLGATEQLHRRRVDRVDRNATGDVPAQRRPQLRARHRALSSEHGRSRRTRRHRVGCWSVSHCRDNRDESQKPRRGYATRTPLACSHGADVTRLSTALTSTRSSSAIPARQNSFFSPAAGASSVAVGTTALPPRQSHRTPAPEPYSARCTSREACFARGDGRSGACVRGLSVR
jgi:hypothetical protein